MDELGDTLGGLTFAISYPVFTVQFGAVLVHFPTKLECVHGVVDVYVVLLKLFDHLFGFVMRQTRLHWWESY